MLFQEKSKKINYVDYPSDKKTVERRIKIRTSIAEEINKIIAVYNHEDITLSKINTSILVNLAMKCFFKELNSLSEEEAIEFIRKGASNN